MFLDALSNKTLLALKVLDSSEFFRETDSYLAGGSALALHLGHRYSYDLDFFTKRDFQEKILIQLLDKSGNFKLEHQEWKTILGVFEDIKFSLFYYKHELIHRPVRILKNTGIASLADIAAMKVAAISDRGTKRDFIDFYFLLPHINLDKILSFYNLKYKNLSANRPHILRSLVYFADAENDPMPQMIKPVDWTEVKKFLEEGVRNVAKGEGLLY